MQKYLSGEMFFHQNYIGNYIYVHSWAAAFSKNPCSSPETERSLNTLTENAQ